MKLTEIFEMLSSGEIVQLSIGGAAAGVIDSTNYAKIVPHINLALTALYRRFTLKEKNISFPLDAAADVYKLHVHDLIRIEKVLTDNDVELLLNVDDSEYSCTTPTMSSLRVPKLIQDQGPDIPEDLKTTSLRVVYRANHPKINVAVVDFDPDTIEVELPYSHLEALLYFVGARVNAPVGMAAEGTVANTYYAKYENACAELEGEGMEVQKLAENSRLQRTGWV